MYLKECVAFRAGLAVKRQLIPEPGKSGCKTTWKERPGKTVQISEEDMRTSNVIADLSIIIRISDIPFCVVISASAFVRNSTLYCRNSLRKLSNQDLPKEKSLSQRNVNFSQVQQHIHSIT